MFKNLFCLTAIAVIFSLQVKASDHDDGEIDLKGRSLNLTDLYVFREDNQTGNPADQGNLILTMNTNPRSLPNQQYFFSSQALYDFHITRVPANNKTDKPVGKDDVILRFKFSAPLASGRQSFTLTAIRDGQKVQLDKSPDGALLLTTPIGDSKANRNTNNQIAIDNHRLTVFAGLREDPFFFDVNQFFKVRAQAIATKAFIGFLAPALASDFTRFYNVNTIVVRVPIDFLQSNAREPIFDVWSTISVPK